MDSGEPTAALLSLSFGPMAVIAFIGLAIVAFVIFMWWRIFSKAGYPGWLSLLFLVPFAKIILYCVLAFSEWPVERELRSLRDILGARGGGRDAAGGAKAMAGRTGQPS